MYLRTDRPQHVLPDQNAAEIYQNDAPDLNPTPDRHRCDWSGHEPAQQGLQAAPAQDGACVTADYDFRVRLRD
jgi:hypothetical protein